MARLPAGLSHFSPAPDSTPCPGAIKAVRCNPKRNPMAAVSWRVLFVALAGCLPSVLIADSTRLEIVEVDYPLLKDPRIQRERPDCEPPAVGTVALSPHFLDISFSVQFRAHILTTGLATIDPNISGREQIPQWVAPDHAIQHEGRKPWDEAVYRDAYQAIARSVIVHSSFEPGVCGGKPVTLPVLLRYTFRIGESQPPQPTGCIDPTIIYKPGTREDAITPPHPAITLTAHVIVLATGSITVVSFDPPQIAGEYRQLMPRTDWLSAYQHIASDDLSRWRMHPASCNGKSVNWNTQVTFTWP